MANIISKQTRDDPKREGAEPDGPIEKFYLGRSLRGIQVRPQAIPVGINGFYRDAIMGEDNEMEKEFVDVLEQAASTALVPDSDERTPRPQDRPAKMRVEYLGDFELRRDHKTVQEIRSKETITVPGGIRGRTVHRGPKKFQPVLPDEPAPSVSGDAPKED